ncbi:3'(2'),5'-bisphosphate nucleotidase CysQ [Sphaerotilus sp.]|uniref:3'(2'),5'-bisphosphate nucleotidase CysQ n=1 Tax=Sphaerotilus sp. TaxID=2093942 RepID=UPI00286EB0EC|nr:3'(2'),5'-bisphosphate nucleotidase CysQ [Sphaerotilus sp.]
MKFLDDHALAAEVARCAGDVLNALRRSPLLEGKALALAGDAIANQVILRLLQTHRPDDGVLSEESAPDPARLAKERVWVIDPLDGSREYGEVNQARTDWAVHVALAIRGIPAACAVALPATGTVHSTAPPPARPAAPAEKLKIVVSRTRTPDFASHVAKALDAELVPMGSAGAKAMAVLNGQAHAYLHAGGQHEWDSCAPVGVALAAGLHASRIDGSVCIYNQENTWMPDLLVCRSELALLFLEAIGETLKPIPKNHV